MRSLVPLPLLLLTSCLLFVRPTQAACTKDTDCKGECIDPASSKKGKSTASGCAWAGPDLPTVTAKWGVVTVNNATYPVDTDEQRAVFIAELHDCLADAAAAPFIKWQNLRDQTMYPLSAAKVPGARDDFVDALENSKPPSR